MTYGYDLELLRKRCKGTLEAVKNLQKHKTEEWLKWRLGHLRLELSSFMGTVWPEPVKKSTQA